MDSPIPVSHSLIVVTDLKPLVLPPAMLLLVNLMAHTAWWRVGVGALTGIVSFGQVRIFLVETVIAMALGYPLVHRDDQGVPVDLHSQFAM